MSRQPSILVIGAGFGGLGAAIALRRAGFSEVTVLEQGEDVGGVWRDNTYPGAACDVPSPLYSWSFAPNPRWGRRYSGHADILDYIKRTAEQAGVRDLVRTGVEVTAAEWDEEAARWRVATSTGDTYEADVLVPAVGQLSRPVVPGLPGIESFDGPAFHSARWRHDVDLRGKRVAVVGTGASAIQFVPGIVDQVGSMTVFQRSAPYVVPKPDRAYTALHHATYSRFPVVQRAGRATTWFLSERLNHALTSGSPLATGLELVFRAMLRLQVRDPGTRRRLLPDHEIGCKRLLFSNDWFRALDRDHVHLVTEPVAEVLPHGVRSADGTEHPADVIVWGTGFAATEFLGPIKVTGTGGHELHDHWGDEPRAHLGMTVPGFPNLFLLYGPNTNLGGSSIIGMLEAQAGYVVQAVRELASGRFDQLEVRREVADAHDQEVQRRLDDTVWAGCASWYRSPGGRITTNWPGLVAEYQQRTSRLDPADFVGGPPRRR